MAFSTVLLVAADAEFTHGLVESWQALAPLPAFVTVGDFRVSESVLSASDLVVCGRVPSETLNPVLRRLHAAGQPVLCIAADAEAAARMRQANNRAVVVLDQEGGLENLVNLAIEQLRCAEARARLRAAEAALAEAQIEAALGHFMLDMRHGLNNALTSILGNSELLLLEPEKLSSDVRDQILTLHSMGLRIHEILQRFTAMEMEMKLSTRSQGEIPLPPRNMIQVASRPELAADTAAHGSGLS